VSWQPTWKAGRAELEQPREPLLRKGALFLVAADQGKAGPKYMGPYKVIDSKSDSEGLSVLLENVADSTEDLAQPPKATTVH
jgi:hypothetical protein